MNPSLKEADTESPLIGVVGNPNTGKTTLFNALTGMHQRVGNYAGVTVERKQGSLRVADRFHLDLLDLPGSYTLTGRSPDERVVGEVLQNRLEDERPLSAVLIVVDAVHLKRNFNLVAEVVQTGLPCVLAINMVDIGRQKGIAVDCARIAARLGIDVVEVCATRREGIEDLIACLRSPRKPMSSPESDSETWIDTILDGAVTRPEGLFDSRSDRVDRVVTHPVYGSVVFFAVMLIVFQAIFSWSAPVMDVIDRTVATLGHWIGAYVPRGLVRSLVVDGAVAGVGSVVIFLPQIAFLFFAISVLEDCGYMPRAALLMDRLMRWCGLSGRSVIPMLCSFACAVPGIMAARTIEDRRDRLATILVAPLMSCSARLPVYTLFIAAFIPNIAIGGWIGLQGLTMMGLYLLGIVVAIPVARILKRSTLRGTSGPFLMELPSYKVPNARTIWLRVYHACHAFLRRAGTVIFVASLIIWALATFPRGGADETAVLRNSFLGRAGRLIEPAVEPLGWDWRLAVASLSAFPAREIVVASLATIYSVEDRGEDVESLKSALIDARREDGSPAFTIPVALSVMVFFALCAQCSSTLAVIRRESGSWGWAGFSFMYMTILAYVGAFAVFQVTSMVGLGG